MWNAEVALWVKCWFVSLDLGLISSSTQFMKAINGKATHSS